MVGSSRSTLLLSKIVPACAGPPERYFRSKELTETGIGRLAMAVLGDGRSVALS